MRAVEWVGELDGVASSNGHVDLVLRDELGAVEVILLRNEGLRLHKNARVRVRDAGRVSECG